MIIFQFLAIVNWFWLFLMKILVHFFSLFFNRERIETDQLVLLHGIETIQFMDNTLQVKFKPQGIKLLTVLLWLTVPILPLSFHTE